MSPLAEKALSIAISQVGQMEKPIGSNWGEPVKSYLASVNINFPAAWCYAFVYWCFDQAAQQLGIPNPLPKTGSVLHAWETADQQHKFTDDPQSGDIFIMDLGKGLGHAGLTKLVTNNHNLSTVEGNTNDTGSREGYEVCGDKTRYNQKPIIGYLRF